MSESDHQIALISWCDRIPEARKIFAIPNGGARHKATAVTLKREGVRAGVPDLMLPVARAGFHGLFIEMKKPKDNKSGAGKPSKDQLERLAELADDGYMAVLCVGWDAAKDTIIDYLALK